MSMLGRYKKRGGFVQLLRLIETCGGEKQDNFMKMLQSEDVDWARAIKMKMLTVDRILSWDDDGVLSKIAGQVPEDAIAALMHSYNKPISDRIMPSFSDTQKERIQEIYDQGEPTEKEMGRAVSTFITEVRSILLEGTVAVESLDNTLPIPPDIEEQLSNGSFKFEEGQSEKKETATSRPVPSKPGVSTSESAASGGKRAAPPAEKAISNNVEELQAEIIVLKEKLSLLAYQNHRLRRELNMAEEKLEKRQVS